MESVRRHLSYSNVVSTLALFAVLATGGAYAASKIGPKDIKKSAVRATHIQKNAVKAKHVARDAVRPKQLRNGAVRTAKIANGAVTGAKVDESGLGTVPSAQSAATAQSAANAAALGGLAASAYQERIRWAQIQSSGGSATITAGSGGMTIVDGAAIGIQHIDVGEDVSDAAILVSVADNGAVPVIVAIASDCSQPDTSCEPAFAGDPSIVKVVTAAASTGNPAGPNPYYLAIVK